MVYVIVTGDIILATPINYEYYIHQILQLIGFYMENHRDIIYDKSINYFGDIRMFLEKYIFYISTGFGGRTQTNGRIHFGVIGMRGLNHCFVGFDFSRISEDSNIFYMNEVMFIQKFGTALYRVEIKKKLI